MTLRLTARGVWRARAWGQLLGGGDHGGVSGVAAALTGVQAQDVNAAGLCIRARTTGLVTAGVHAALSETGAVVLVWSLRGTRHLHDRADVRWLIGLLGPVFARPGRRAEQLGIAGATGDAAVAALAAALSAERSLDRSQVRDLLAAVGVDPTGQAPVHVVRRAALEGLLCVVPGAQGRERYELLDAWAPPAPPVGSDRAAAALVRRYLGAYGPATVADFAAWSGLPSSPARDAWAAIGPERTEVATPAGPASVLRERVDELAAAAGRPAPLRLTGAFDTLWLGYADRTSLTASEDAGRVNRGGGMVRPLVVSDGLVVGTWGRRRERGVDLVEAAVFRHLTPSETAALEAEVADVGRFLGTSAELRLGEG